MHSVQTRETQPPQREMQFCGFPGESQLQVETLESGLCALVPNWSTFMQMRVYICSLIGPGSTVLIDQNCTSWLVFPEPLRVASKDATMRTLLCS